MVVEGTYLESIPPMAPFMNSWFAYRQHGFYPFSMLDLPLETSIETMNLSKTYNTPDQQDHLVENLDLGVIHDKRILLISIV